MKDSDLDTPRLLHSALRTKVPGVSLRQNITAEGVLRLRDRLITEYEDVPPAERRSGFVVEHLGYQRFPTLNNYWYLGNGVSLVQFSCKLSLVKNNSKLLSVPAAKTIIRNKSTKLQNQFMIIL